MTELDDTPIHIKLLSIHNFSIFAQLKITVLGVYKALVWWEATWLLDIVACWTLRLDKLVCPSKQIDVKALSYLSSTGISIIQYSIYS